jgi:hypothetical protein
VGKDEDEAAGKGKRQEGGKQAEVACARADAAKRRRTEGWIVEWRIGLGDADGIVSRISRSGNMRYSMK